MEVKGIFLRLSDLGRKAPEDPHERRMYRAANLFIINAIFWMLVSVVVDYFDGGPFPNLGSFVIPGIALFNLVPLYLNFRGKTAFALTLLNLVSCSVLTFFSIRDGEESAVHLHFISAIVGTTVMFNHRDYRKELMLNLAFLFVGICITFTGYALDWPHIEMTADELSNARSMHFLIVAFGAVFFSVVVVNTFQQQQKELQKALKEKDLLLSEVLHRVKNNMAVIISLLNLKKNMSNDEETVEALEQCRMRVMSMAMVQQRIYNTKSFVQIDLHEYLSELCDEVIGSFPQARSVQVSKKLETCRVNINKAIPIGLIVNEVITNAFKHGFKNLQEDLKLHIELQHTENGKCRLVISDNGTGIQQTDYSESDTMGMMLIYSLSEQVDGECQFEKRDGTIFTLNFPLD
jgi:two-component sensor histidine kinase